MNRVSVWQEFNACQFLVSFCLLIFSILYAFREQLFILWPYWLVFLPLFIWKILAILGAIIGIFTYCCIRPRNRERNSPIHCRALFLNLIETILLFLFEFLICYNLEQPKDSEYRLTWIVCFLPLIVLSIISVFTYVWLLRHGRSWEIQALFVVNILQFIFFALKLDNSILTWNYAAVFIPLWIVMGISIIFCIGRIIWTFVHYYRNDNHQIPMSQQQLHRRCCQILTSPTVGHICVLLFLLIFQILLVFYLERSIALSFIVVCLPLYIALIILIYMSFGSRVPPNHWWFGLRQDACGWLLHLCPIFETYANIEYHFTTSDSPSLPTHNISSTTANPSIISTGHLNRNIESTRRFFFRKKSPSFCDQSKVDHDENDLLTTVFLSPSNILKLHEPD
ncbi:unnamed protein product [Adineta steineri]|uniref:Uncharacterized protein n=1 Tax=Adineta steineri TaxID=433720 RepID=A0A816EUP4_9BILA|nr:unnamed protein product [Adineta steineri]CAF1298350.1 unnamed protein product [Adineta steineri]CAF1522456.1 unnamed protein product [Adineta steineri]CAF1650759.1 unnamed protein product [Adineta steineri]